jgi:hypothetical protein
VTENRRHRVGFAALLLQEHGIYRLRIAGAQDLLDEGARLVDETGRESVSGAKLLLVLQATRATHIFESVVALCQIGRGVPASMLNRALLEEVLDVHWVAANPELAPELATQHQQLIDLAERQNSLRFGREAEPLDQTEEAEFKSLRKRFNNFNAAWTLADDPTRIALIKEGWDVEAAQDIDYVYEVIQRQNNLLLHSSPTAYLQTLIPGRGIPNRIGPDQRWREALGHGALAYYFITRVIAAEFALDRGELERQFERLSCLTKVVSAEELGAAGDGACPCGSGASAPECHGS